MAGRSKGSRNGTPTVNVELSRCQTCGSTERSDFYAKTVQPYAGETADGTKYNVIVRRRCNCLKCGQQRIERSLELDPELEPATVAPTLPAVVPEVASEPRNAD
jgi:hypothetical protein